MTASIYHEPSTQSARIRNAQGTAEVYVDREFLDVNKTRISYSYVSGAQGANTPTWRTVTSTVTAPSNAKFVRIWLVNYNNSNSTAWFDDIEFTPVNGNYSLISASDYYPFGSVAREWTNTTPDVGKFKCQQKERDIETGYDYFEARTYDSQIGRFLQVDPEFEQFYHMDPYTGMGNNPVSNVDPDGKVVRLKKGEYQSDANIRSAIKSAYMKSKSFREIYNFARSSKSYLVRLEQLNLEQSNGMLNNGQTTYKGYNTFFVQFKFGKISERTVAHELHHAVVGILSQIRTEEHWELLINTLPGKVGEGSSLCNLNTEEFAKLVMAELLDSNDDLDAKLDEEEIDSIFNEYLDNGGKGPSSDEKTNQNFGTMINAWLRTFNPTSNEE